MQIAEAFGIVIGFGIAVGVVIFCAGLGMIALVKLADRYL